MTLSRRERTLLAILVPSLLAGAFLQFYVFNDAAGDAGATARSADKGSPMSEQMAQQRAARLRQVVKTLPTREAVMKQAVLDLADRERGIIQAATAAQAQATLLEIARRVGKGEQIDVRGADFSAPKNFGEYGLVFAAITFDCRIEQLVNFLAGLSVQPELVVPSEERISSNNNKEKLMAVRIVLAGVVPKKLVPEKKGLGAF